MEDQKFYLIADLEHLTGLSRRTIHYYIQEKVIPPPEGVSGAARYAEEHLLRLILVKQMQQSHLKLSGIKEALDGLSIAEMRDISQAVKKRPTPKWDREAIKNWIAEDRAPRIIYSLNDHVNGSIHETEAGYSSDRPGEEGTRSTEKKRKSTSLLNKIKRSSAEAERSWERFEISEGIELNVRSDISQEYKTDIKNIVIKLRRIMRGDSSGI